MIRITMQNGKTIDIELDHSAAPITCENFEKLVKDGFYNGLTFHRIIPGFMIQGGDPQGTGMGGPGWHIKGEFLQNGVIRKIEHRAVASGQVNAVEHLTGNFIQAFRVPQHIPEFRIVPAALDSLSMYIVSDSWIDGGVASLRTCDTMSYPRFSRCRNVVSSLSHNPVPVFRREHPGSGLRPSVSSFVSIFLVFPVSIYKNRPSSVIPE